MSTFPNFSEIERYIQDKLKLRVDNPTYISSLNCWIRITSGTGDGLYMVSNPDFNLFSAAGALYGSTNQSGAIGQNWDGKVVATSTGQPFRPSPVVSGLEIDEGKGEITRKASFSITAFSLEQMELISRYFLQPGFSIFIEWGWNTADGVSGLQKLKTNEIAKFQSFKNTNEIRQKAKGDYDNYLGFMSGGGVSLDGDKWNINVECTGYTELPAYLNVSESGQHTKCTNLKTSELYGEDYMEDYDKNRQIWMRVFNELPSNKRTDDIKVLGEEDGPLYDISNFINFDEDAAERMNSLSRPNMVGRLLRKVGIGSADVDIGGEGAEISRGKDLMSTNRYIRFGALMEIFSKVGTRGIRIGNSDENIVKYKINTNRTFCSAFKHIFSADGSKLFIPNPNTPNFNLKIVDPDRGGDEPIRQFLEDGGTKDCSVKREMQQNTAGHPAVGLQDGSDKNWVLFPEQTSIDIKLKEGVRIKRRGFEYGKLDNLYVNFDFACSIMDTSNFHIKDAIYQILNGISSAVNGMWDFQIVESESEESNSTELVIYEMNFASDMDNEEINKTYEFALVGNDSTFEGGSLDLNIQGAMMNRIIGERLGRNHNSDTENLPQTRMWHTDDEDEYPKDRLDVALVNDAGEIVDPDDCEENRQWNVGQWNASIEQWNVGYPALGRRRGISSPEQLTDLSSPEELTFRELGGESDDDTQNAKDKEKAAEELKSELLEILLNRITFVPKVGEGGPAWLQRNISGSGRKELLKDAYIVSFQDKTIFTSLHLYDTTNEDRIEEDGESISPLMPIEFEFTIHGISGINRGNKFKVKGLPKEYNRGFFQVLSVNHTVDGMQWKTKITGGYRQR